MITLYRARARQVTFPDYDSPSSSLVKMYLKGDFGKEAGDVNAYAASAFYAVDRFASYRMKWKDDYASGVPYISDRYVTSRRCLSIELAAKNGVESVRFVA